MQDPCALIYGGTLVIAPHPGLGVRGGRVGLRCCALQPRVSYAKGGQRLLLSYQRRGACSKFLYTTVCEGDMS